MKYSASTPRRITAILLIASAFSRVMAAPKMRTFPVEMLTAMASHRCLLIVWFFLSLNLSAQNILVLPPSASTPWYVWWVSVTNSYGQAQWVVQGAQTTNFCKDVLITWTTTPGKLYSVETFWPGGDMKTLFPPTSSGTNTLMAFRTGTKYREHFFRVKQW